jgi:hypothetical protein
MIAYEVLELLGRAICFHTVILTERVQLGQSFSNLLKQLSFPSFSLTSRISNGLAEACVVNRSNLEMQLSRDLPPSTRAYIALYSMGI